MKASGLWLCPQFYQLTPDCGYDVILNDLKRK